jgi:replicative DNA helicase
MTTLSNLGQFGDLFQLKVISCILTDRNFLINVNDLLKEEDFNKTSDKWIINETLKYYKVYNTNPTMEVLKIELKKIENEIIKIAVKERLKEAYSIEQNDIEYVKKEYINFVRNQQLKKALLESVDLLNDGEFDSIRNIINNAIKKGQDRNLGHMYEKDIETRYREDSRKIIPFPWKSFNNITQGGYGNGDLVLIFGNPKGGKSWAIIAMAAEAVKAGYNIVFYALELGENYVGKRFDAYFTGIPVDKLDKHRSTVESITRRLPGKLIIKEYPPKRASLNTIESHINQLEFKPDGIFIDYLDLLQNRKSRSERKDDIDDVYTDVKGLAKELDIPIVSPSQANRLGADKAILESTHIAGSYDKIMIGDIVISLSRGRVDRLEGTGRWHFMGNRYGPDGCTFNSYNIDTSIGHFEIDEHEMDEEEIENYNKTNKQNIENSEKQRMKKKFLEFENQTQTS